MSRDKGWGLGSRDKGLGTREQGQFKVVED